MISFVECEKARGLYILRLRGPRGSKYAKSYSDHSPDRRTYRIFDDEES